MPPVEEVLILHHSHVDVGYTHPQSMYWELQKDYLAAALDMLDRTESWPDDVSRPRWTAEATAPVVRWLQTAAAADIARFRRHLASGRLGIAAFEYNTTPLASAESLARQLYHVRMLREVYGAEIRAAHQHDVNGIPWTAVDLLLDAGIELFVAGINLHLGGAPLPRPAVFRWRGPGGRELLVVNGEHYSMFDQWCDTQSRDLDTIQAGLDKYLRRLADERYPHDFAYLTATNAPLMYDNSPPNQDLPDLIRQWNEAGRRPRLRMVTPNELLARVKQIPRERLPLVSGDWTDYWCFGAASSAAETRLARRMAANAAAIDLLRSGRAADARLDGETARLWRDINLYNEHTWGAHNTLDADNPFVVTQWHLKAHAAYDGGPLSEFLLRKELHRLAGNPWQSWTCGGVLVVNPTGLAQRCCVTGHWKDGKSQGTEFGGGGGAKHVEPHFMGTPREASPRPVDSVLGPVPLAPYQWKIVPWSQLQPVPEAESIRTGDDFIETDHYRLTFDPATGRIGSLFDKARGREVVAANAPWGFFQLVHERPANRRRSAFHVRNVEAERYGRTGWKPGWRATRTSYRGAVACRVERHRRAATLVITGHAEGIAGLEQRITLHADSPLLDLSVRFLKKDVRTPEAVYFAFPLALAAGWRAHFDTAGMPTELDAEQIPGTCRDWQTVDTFAAVHEADFGATLYCPDAPMVQIGEFNWARKQDAIPRRENPWLLAWALNNYWETNFRASQPGLVELRWSFTSHGAFDPLRAVLEGQQTLNPPVTHLVLDDAAPREGKLLEIDREPALGENVVATYVKPAEDGRGLVVRLLNLGDKPVAATVRLPGRTIAAARQCGTLEEDGEGLDDLALFCEDADRGCRERTPCRSGEQAELGNGTESVPYSVAPGIVQGHLALSEGAAVCPLEPRRLTTFRLQAHRL